MNRKLETLGQFEQLVLVAVQRIDNAYAIPIQALVEELYGRPVKYASVYTALDRLEEKGYVRSRMADPLPERANLPKRFYTVTPTGQRALKESEQAAERFLAAARAKKQWKPATTEE